MAVRPSAVLQHGRLHVDAGQIVDEHDRAVALRGMSLFWSQWMGHYYNSNVIRWLRDDWHCSIVRVPMGIEPDGYLANPAREQARVENAVDVALSLGLYVIIDWHDHQAHRHQAAAEEFFRRMAQRYGSQPGVLFETWNEPLNTNDWRSTVKPYHEALLRTIRPWAPETLVLCGTPSWDQDVDRASIEPLSDRQVAYTLHFYAATHGAGLRAKAAEAISRGLPLFVSEWGTCEASGDGPINTKETKAWLDFLNRHNVSWCNWSISDKPETSSALRSGASTNGHWAAVDLSPSGTLLRQILRSSPHR